MGFLSLFKREPEPAPEQPAAKKLPTRQVMRSLMKRAMDTAFSAGNSDRTTASWSTFPQPADVIVRTHQRPLVARARQQATENSYARAFLRMCRQNIVGPQGIQLQAQARDASGKLNKDHNAAIEAAWATWGKAKNCDVAGKKSWLDFELLAVQGAGKDGEFMFRKVYGREAGPWGYALQWLDPQRCPVDYDVERFKPGVFIRHGIEFNNLGRPLAYHFTTADESEADYSYGGRRYVRIPADEIIHGFKDELGGQKRGLPWMATGLFRLRHIGGMEDAAVMNARVGAAKMGTVTFDNESSGPDYDEEQGLELDVDPATFLMLPKGAKLEKWDPQYPSGEFAPFTKHMLRSLAAGWGVLYNNLANDLEGVNFSSIRQGTLDERERWKEDQQWLIQQLHEQVFEDWLRVSLLAGRIRLKGQALSVTRIDEYANVTWQPRRWTWIDPGADVKAAVESKNNLLMSPGQIIREGGRDPSTVYAELAQDIEEMKAAGIPEEFIKLAFGEKLAPPAPKEPKNGAAAAA